MKWKYFRSAGGEGGGKIVHLSGTEYIEEKLLGMTFRISPEAFFQINTLAAEALYSKAVELAQPFDDTTLLDVCCGTGTIGLIFAKVSPTKKHTHFENLIFLFKIICLFLLTALWWSSWNRNECKCNSRCKN